MVELLVVVGVIALLIGILIPTLGSAVFASRVTTDTSNLRQIGVGIGQYLIDDDERLPQVWIDPATGDVRSRHDPAAVHVGTLFGGKMGALPFLGLDQIGASRRPLNPYVGYDNATPDARVAMLTGEARRDAIVETELFRSPLDRGGSFVDAFATLTDWGSLEQTMYNAVGTSYAINDHALDEDPLNECIPTLVPLRDASSGRIPRDGRMPEVSHPNRTWLVGTASIYNYDESGTAEGVMSDRGLGWFRGEVRANLLFVDLSVGASYEVPTRERALESSPDTAPEIALNQTSDYTYFPTHDWWPSASICAE